MLTPPHQCGAFARSYLPAPVSETEPVSKTEPVARHANLADCRGSIAGSRGQVAEWQTRTVQVRVSVRTWGFNSPLAHPRPSKRGTTGFGTSPTKARHRSLSTTTRSQPNSRRRNEQRPRPVSPVRGDVVALTFGRPPVTGSIAENRAAPDSLAHSVRDTQDQR